ncbi:hypothetical protein QBC35DRAFT_498562 [Podospora australis]|uniref:Secreted protein n=1 Tax=Podospora australis TaxID=1536484 RepID=A0AAN6WWQ7_9PEZI|nr:hypothetical protein QBC35DRAFT_498562 [Podospora australis]
MRLTNSMFFVSLSLSLLSSESDPRLSSRSSPMTAMWIPSSTTARFRMRVVRVFSTTVMSRPQPGPVLTSERVNLARRDSVVV